MRVDRYLDCADGQAVDRHALAARWIVELLACE